MKKNSRTLAAVAFVSVTAFSFWGLRLNSQDRSLSELQLANVEALVDDGEGTEVGYCYKYDLDGVTGWSVMCDGRTSDSMIYPCNNRERFSKAGSKDRCTK